MKASKVKPLLIAAILALCVLCTQRSARAFDDDYNQKLNGATLHFRVRGESKTNPYLLILHGGPGYSAFMFYPWGSSLEKKLNVVYLDQRGSGGSERLKFKSIFAPKPEEVADYTITNLIKDIEAVREYLKVDSWFLLGHSWGGMLGLEYVSAHPKRTIGYIHMDGLLSTPLATASICDEAESKFKPFLESGDSGKKRQADIILKSAKQIRELPNSNPQRFMRALQLATGPAGLYFAGEQQAGFKKFQEKIADALKPYNTPQSALIPAQEPSLALIQTENYLTRDDTPLLAKIIAPVLVLNGKQDGVISAKIAQLVHKGIKGSKIEIIEECGHFPFAEQPEKTTSAILKFVEENDHR